MKTRIHTLSFQSLRIGELFAFLQLVLPILKLYPALSAKLVRLVEELAKTMVALEATASRASYESQTKAIKAADTKRDRSLSRFNQYIESFLFSDDPAEEEHACLIKKSLKDAGNINNQSLKEETSTIHGLNTLFTTNVRYVQALAALNATELWGKVWDDELVFEQTFGYRSGIMVEEKVDAAAYEVAKIARQQCSAIFELIEDSFNVEEKPEYLAMMEKINLEVDKTMAAVRPRVTLAAKQTEEKKNGAQSAE